jgi:hypothetical protein
MRFRIFTDSEQELAYHLTRIVAHINDGLALIPTLQAPSFCQRQLQAALDANRDINVAIGITMVKSQLGRSAAFDQRSGSVC